MDDNAPKENPPPDFNKIDLSQLQGFSFGTQWTQDKSGSSDKSGRTDQRPRREGPGEGPSDRRDRRAFRKPESGHEAPPGSGAPVRRETFGDRPPRQDSRDFRGGARPGGERPSFPPGRGSFQDRTPYDSPHFSATFYPEDTSFNALVKTIRASCRTIELFEIARTVLGKPERFTVLVGRKDPASPARPRAEGAEQPAKPAEETAPPAPAKQPLFMSVPDGLPFESEEAAIAHVLSRHLKAFFEMTEVEVEPPKGNFQVVNRCGVTGELLGPPNYHRYNQIVQQHYTAKAIRIPFEAYRSRIESVREPEAINQWLEKMKRITRYVLRGATKTGPAAGQPVKAETPAAPNLPPTEPSASGEGSVPAEGQAPGVSPAVPTATETPVQTALFFDNMEDARVYLLTQARDKIVRPALHARFHGRELEFLPPGEIRRALEGALERQRRFPLDTANALRGRLRREHFTIFKKGAKGISYVCAVKRKFRVPGQTFAESIGSLISFIEVHPMIKAGELVKRFLGISEDTASGEPLAQVLSVEQREKIARMQGDLLWLVREGYVTEFIDGGLYAPPAMVEARKKEVEHDDHDPENFPERPSQAETPGSAEASPPDAGPVEAAPEQEKEPAAPSDVGVTSEPGGA